MAFKIRERRTEHELILRLPKESGGYLHHPYQVDSSGKPIRVAAADMEKVGGIKLSDLGEKKAEMLREAIRKLELDHPPEFIPRHLVTEEKGKLAFVTNFALIPPLKSLGDAEGHWNEIIGELKKAEKASPIFERKDHPGVSTKIKLTIRKKLDPAGNFILVQVTETPNAAVSTKTLRAIRKHHLNETAPHIAAIVNGINEEAVRYYNKQFKKKRSAN